MNETKNCFKDCKFYFACPFTNGLRRLEDSTSFISGIYGRTLNTAPIHCNLFVQLSDKDTYDVRVIDKSNKGIRKE